MARPEEVPEADALPYDFVFGLLGSPLNIARSALGWTGQRGSGFDYVWVHWTRLGSAVSDTGLGHSRYAPDSGHVS